MIPGLVEFIAQPEEASAEFIALFSLFWKSKSNNQFIKQLAYTSLSLAIGTMDQR